MNSEEQVRQDVEALKESEKVIAELVKTYDFRGMAKAYEKQKISWNTKNWEKFVKDIRKQVLDEVKERKMRYGEVLNKHGLKFAQGYNNRHNEILKKLDELKESK